MTVPEHQVALLARLGSPASAANEKAPIRGLFKRVRRVLPVTRTVKIKSRIQG